MSGYVGSKRSSSLVSFDEGTIGSGVTFPTGHIIRVETTNVTTAFVGANNTKNVWNDLTPMTVTLNNKLASSKCFVWAVVNMSLRDNYQNGIRLIRRVNNADTAIALNTNNSSGIKGTTNNFTLQAYGSDNQAGFPIMWMDTTSATSVTYKLQYFIPNIATEAFYFNQNKTTTNSNQCHGVSSISVMEIAQ